MDFPLVHAALVFLSGAFVERFRPQAPVAVEHSCDCACNCTGDCPPVQNAGVAALGVLLGLAVPPTLWGLREAWRRLTTPTEAEPAAEPLPRAPAPAARVTRASSPERARGPARLRLYDQAYYPHELS